MKIVSPRHLRRALPALITDDLRLVVPRTGVKLTPIEATALGCRLIRQASVADRVLVKKASKRKKGS